MLMVMLSQDTTNSHVMSSGSGREEEAVDESLVDYIVIDNSCFTNASELFDHLFRSVRSLFEHVISIPAICEFQSPHVVHAFIPSFVDAPINKLYPSISLHISPALYF